MVPLGFLSVAIMIGRQLHVESLGHYAAVMAIALIAVSGVGAGFPLMALRDTVARRCSDRYVSRLLQTNFAVSSAGIIATGTIEAVVSRSAHGFVLGALAGLSFAFMNAMIVVSAAHAGKQAYRSSALGEAVGGLSLAGFTAIALLLGTGLVGVLIAATGAWACALVLLLLLLRQHDIGSGPESRRQLFLRSLSYLAVGLSNGGYTRLDAFVLRLVSGASVTGLYASAYRLLGPFGLLGSAFAYVFFGKLPAHGLAWSAGWIEAVRRTQRRFCAVMALLELPVLIVAPLLVAALFGSDYSQAGNAARVLMVSVLPYAWYWPLIYALNSADERREVLLVFGLGAFVDVAALYTLAPRFGPLGAALAWLIAECTVVLIAEYRFRFLARRRMLGQTAALVTSEPQAAVRARKGL